MPLDPAVIVDALRLPAGAVTSNWPLITAALDELGIRSDLVEIAVAATVAVETARTFQPINEYGGDAYFTHLYDGRKDLGNVEPGDGARFHGRGFVQITGRVNYESAGESLGLFLLDSPELALEPVVAARILAWFFKTHRVCLPANTRQWQTVRNRVNGGLNGWLDFKSYVDALHG